MATTRADAVIDALVAALSADITLAGLVWDGPPITGDPLPEVVTIGFDFDEDDDTAADIRQEYHDLGPAARRDEVIDIRCAAMSSNGDADIAAARARAAVLLGAVESVLRANPSLGVTESMRTEVSLGTLRQSQSSEGAAAIVQFTVTATLLI